MTPNEEAGHSTSGFTNRINATFESVGELVQSLHSRVVRRQATPILAVRDQLNCAIAQLGAACMLG